MEDQLISFETAKLAKEKGFREGNHRYRCANDKVSYIYDEDGFDPEVYLIASTQSLLQRWLREKHQIDIDVSCDYERENWFSGYRKKGYKYNHLPSRHSTYEEALERSLRESLKLIS